MTFKTVQPKIQEWVSSSPRVNFSKVIQFAVLTIQQPFHSIAKQIDDVNLHGINSKYVWGNKRKTFEWLETYPGTTHDIYRNLDSLTDDAALGIMMEVPGLGVAKAGFVLQMTKGRVGCLDIWNSRLYNKDTLKGKPYKKLINDNRIFKDNKLHLGFFKSRPLEYTLICKSIGTDVLWDNWCNLIDKKYPKHFCHQTSSEYHWGCLKRIA
jgi:hypothetical protein